ncbi:MULTISPECIES: UbiX family flavin prenyltransferase [unclassified Campylobacter]|uniref:UbiX family flavin prenyltransferase n=1 Tax=unclassified Campylobacter TaxID=2593542 RepID=UPI0022E9B273|nr:MULTISPECIES: UbiX family flavin prenyltransferase [unclassified Campylobacter]MDA3079972.1 UbiX family flavin prenyltransferase [Campylobacter sp. CS_NA2]MDA3081268.1 UbiX family flavin prenyltransferase [Campylobacter sp. CS_NA1]MDA3086426.1 UbiX family flavin prenyltransferase [Campylobacter sp. CS_ED1]MDA3090994.1 UbiX family flavin prenyltransferase [Campylobacter sp. CS_ED2]WBR51908.1 UbiX family flavin prenyltransferase [Campylobacter sp. CS_NA3]
MKILVCISGASFAGLGLDLLQNLSNTNHEIYAIVSQNAKIVLQKEENIKFNQNEFKNVIFFDNDDISASVASGSFGIEKTIIAPCSVNSLAKIANGICDTLITRAAAVALKEQKKLILGVREMPFSPISLRQMSELSNLGVIIAPPVVANYANCENLGNLKNFIIGKWLDLLNIENEIYKRWK